MMNKNVTILVIEYQWERTLMRVLLIMLAVLLAGYLYFVATSVLNIIARREADTQSSKIESSIGMLEQKYFALSQHLTPEEGSTLGLSIIKDQTYVTRHTMVGETPASSVTI